MFAPDCWYAAGFPDEFGRALVGRTFLGEPVVLFRTEAGELVALEDRCSHRRLPLSVGRLKGDTVECGYHGLVYDCSGACIKVPGQDDVPRTARLKRYPVADMHGYSWIWIGDPGRADRRSIPDYSRLSVPELGRHRIALHVEANYQLIIDNLLDLSHLPYVHGTTTGNLPVSESASVKTERHGNTVQVKRWAENVEPAPTFVQFGGYQGKVDIWQISQFQPPCYIRVSYGSGPTGTGIPEGDAIWEPGHWGFQVFHGITPETETTTHQFRYILHEKGSADAATIAEFYRQNDQIINEDRVIFAIQQKALSTTGDGASAADLKTSAIIRADGGLIQARAIISSMLQGDHAAAPTTLRA
jgi:phenylpropionate dioxygenase-like ring-hydroxylating dioxygenase large terminal subunit